MRKLLLAGLPAMMVGAVAVLVAPVGPAAAGPASAVPASAASQRMSYAYVAVPADNMVAVFDEQSGRYVTQAIVGERPIAVAVTPDGARLYVANEASDTVSVVDTATNTAIATFYVNRSPNALAVTPDGKRLYAVAGSTGKVAVVDTATNTVTTTVDVGGVPSGVAVAPDGKRAYVVNAGGDSVSVIDTATNTITGTIGVGDNPVQVVFSPDGKRAYVANYNSGAVSVIDTAAGAVTATVTVGSGSNGIAITPSGDKVYVTNSLANTVSVLATATNTVTRSVTVGKFPCDVRVSPDGAQVYVASANSDGLSVIATSDDTLLRTVETGASLRGVAFAAVQPAPPTASLVLSADGETNAVWYDISASKHGFFFGFGVDYKLDFGDGSNAISPSQRGSHEYPRGGTYTATLTMTDSGGLSSTASVTVTVRPADRIALLSHSNLRYVSAESAGAQPLMANRAAVGAWEQFDLIDLGGEDVALRAVVNQRYLTVDPNWGNRLVANGATAADATHFRKIAGANGIFSLQSRSNNMYVTTNNGGAPLTADRSAIGPWEQFNAAIRTNMTMTALTNHRYVTAEAAGTAPLIANRSSAGLWETFDQIDAGDGWVAFFSRADGRFVTAESAGNQPLIANRTDIGAWEKFKLVHNADYNPSQSILAFANNKYVTAEAGGNQPLIANRTAIGPWEQFSF